MFLSLLDMYWPVMQTSGGVLFELGERLVLHHLLGQISDEDSRLALYLVRPGRC